MTLKILSLLTLVILLTGCGENTIIECKQMGFKGITFVSESSIPNLYCSNGTYITTKDGKEQYYTKWIDTNNLTELSSEFLSSLDSINHSFTNFKDFFTSLVKSIIAFNASEISGKF
jgi:hypothetical protein